MENRVISNDEFNRNDYQHSGVVRVFQANFGLNYFYDIQLPVINAAILGYNCLAIMPTGGLKSVCYQIPALYSAGITVVITPLKSIIYNQLQKLQSLNIMAVHLSGDQVVEVEEQIKEYLKKLKANILYVTPDKAIIHISFLKELRQMNIISRFIIDEAHCISDHHQFRGSYHLDSKIKDLFNGVQIMAFTPTATPCIQLDIMKKLNLENARYFVSRSLNRLNIKYSIEKLDKYQDIANFVCSQPQNDCGIVFCRTKCQVDNLVDKLKANGIRASPYHGDMDDKDRMNIQANWQVNNIQVLCATYALGMGVDKSNVRFVLHYSMPPSMEHYFNETGRAGHDGGLAQCILSYNEYDYSKHRSNGENIQDLFEINNYCNNYLDCRRSLLLNYFGEDYNSDDCLRNPNTACDNCLKNNPSKDIAVLDIVRNILGSLRANTNRKFTMFDICYALQENILKTWKMVDIERLIVYMIKQNYLRKNITFDDNGAGKAYIELGPNYENIMNENVDLRFKIHSE